MTDILVFNCGSSSLSYKLYRADPDLAVIAEGKAYHVATKSAEASYLVHRVGGREVREERPLPAHRDVAAAVLEHLHGENLPAGAVGHRFVHGGPEFRGPALITEESRPRLRAVNPLAPVHNPNAMSVVDLCSEVLPRVPQFAVFDTAFHATLPDYAWRYALPYDLVNRFGFRKYGFHGLSYHYVTLETARVLGRPVEDLRIVACHLGTGGSSVAAIDRGRSVETSMGYTPLAGLIMSTRSGDVDPAVVVELIAEHGYSAAQVDRLLNKESGLVGVAGESSDLLELLRLAEVGHERARLAVAMYVHRLKCYIGAYAAVLGGFEVLAFTDDTGVRGWQVRERACDGLEWFGVRLDPAANRSAPTDRVTEVSSPESKVRVLVVPTDEEWVVASEGLALLQGA
jgi:acetate kinase